MSRYERFLTAAMLIAASGLTGACGVPFDPEHRITNFRVLCVVADPPEVARGAQSTLTLVSADTMTRAVEVLWYATVGTAETGEDGVIPTRCEAPDCEVGHGERFVLTAPRTGGTPDLSLRPTINIVGFACAGGTIERIAAPAVNELPLRCVGNGSQGRLFTRKMYMMGFPPFNAPNSNPRITDIRFGIDNNAVPIPPDGQATVPHCVPPTRESPTPCQLYRVEVATTATSREMYRAIDFEAEMLVDRTEAIRAGYFVDHGTLNSLFRADEGEMPMPYLINGWRPPTVAGPVILRIFIDDGRGGFDAVTRRIMVE